MSIVTEVLTGGVRGGTSILFAASAGTPTFSMAGYAFDLPPAASGYSAGYPRAKSLIDRVASFANFTAVSASPAAASIPRSASV